MKENSREEDIKLLEEFSNESVLYGSTVGMTLEKYKDLQLSTEHILSEYKRVLKENEELKENLKEENELNKIIKYTKLDELFCRRNGKKVEQAIKLRDELLKLPECKLYGIKKCKKSVILITKEEVIPVQEVKDKIEEIQKDKDNKYYDMFLEIRDIDNTIKVLQELIEGRK